MKVQSGHRQNVGRGAGEDVNEGRRVAEGECENAGGAQKDAREQTKTRGQGVQAKKTPAEVRDATQTINGGQKQERA